MPIDYYHGLVVERDADTVAAAGGMVRVGHACYHDVDFHDFLDALRARIDADPSFPRDTTSLPGPVTGASPDGDALTYETLFQRIGGRLDPAAVVCCDLGVGMFLGIQLRLARENGFIAQADWASLGFAAPCALGLASARVGTPEALDAALAEAAACGWPYLLHVEIGKHDLPDSMKRLVESFRPGS